MLPVLIATLVGLGLRAWLAFSSGLWRDEVQGLLVATLPSLRDVLTFLVEEESHPPLFYLIERGWNSAFGGSDASLALLGLIPGVAIVPLAAAAGWAISSRRAGILAAWFTAFAWPLVQQSSDARPYALLGGLTLAAAWASFQVITRRSRAACYWYVGCCVALLYTHNWAVLVVAGLGVLMLSGLRFQSSDRREYLRTWVTVHAAIAMLYLPWVPALLRQAREGGYAPAVQFPFEWLLIAPTVALGMTLVLLIPALLLILLGTARTGVHARAVEPSRHFAWAAVLPTLLAAAAWKFSLVTLTHCAAILTPVALTAVAIALGRDAPAPATRRLMAAAGFLGLLGVSLTERWDPDSNIREVADFVRQRRGQRDLIILHSASIGPAFLRYLESPTAQVVTYPLQDAAGPIRFREWGSRLAARDDLEAILRRIEAAARDSADVWIVSEVREDAFADSTAALGTRDGSAYLMASALKSIRHSAMASMGEPVLVVDPNEARRTRERVRLEWYALHGDR
jgi:hypothetical protein